MMKSGYDPCIEYIISLWVAPSAQPVSLTAIKDHIQTASDIVKKHISISLTERFSIYQIVKHPWHKRPD